MFVAAVIFALWLGAAIITYPTAFIANKIQNYAVSNPMKTTEMVLGAIAGILVAQVFDVPYHIEFTFAGAATSRILGEVF